MIRSQPNNETSEATAELIDAEVKSIITQGYEFAKDKVLMGVARRSIAMSEKEKKVDCVS
ncbi:MAG: hypothetical protein O7C60_02380 [Rickettsia endosymbiont of Ixodes persulcatus]|nr:hypothetical protein [Rickettsia endosymbiont of Ixodes persulcatus]